MTRVQVEPRSCDQRYRNNDALTLPKISTEQPIHCLPGKNEKKCPQLLTTKHKRF